jgi:hypothetical protein
MASAKWKLLRTKTDPTVDDPAWMAGAIATSPAQNIRGSFEPQPSGSSPAYTGIEIWAVPVVSAGNHTQVAAGAGTVEMLLVDVIMDGAVLIGHRSVGEADASPIAVPLNDTAYFPLNGSEGFTIQITNDVAYPGGSTALDIRWRPVTR